MEFAWKGPTLIGNLERVIRAEQLGFDSAWFSDSQMLESDVYMALAVAATRTSKIKLGTGVSVAGTRIAPVTACSMATLNKLAPGRTFISISSGNTAWRVMGQRPQLKIPELEDYIHVVRELLAGREVEFTVGGHTAPVQFRDRDGDAIDVEHRIPVYVVGAGPLKRAMAGRVGDGVVDALPDSPEGVKIVLDHARAGAQAAGRKLPDDFVFACGGTAIVLDPGEDLMSEEVLAVAGPMVMRRFHGMYSILLEGGKGVGPGGRTLDNLPPDIRPLWDEYCELLAGEPLERRHYRINHGHGRFVHPDEMRFVTPETMRGSMIIGRAEEVIEQLRAYDDAGVDMFWINCPPNDRGARTAERFSKLVMAKM
jgi:5,10-methylenetetrahydromethanopterin reductase